MTLFAITNALLLLRVIVRSERLLILVDFVVAVNFVVVTVVVLVVVVVVKVEVVTVV